MSDVTEALTTLWQSRGLSPSQLRAEDDGTILASDRRGLAESQTLFATDSAEEEALSLSPEPFELHELLGRGGMGMVRSANQATLRRPVAVKTALDAADRGAIAALLKEAWVGGSLEHPNVIPVHALARASEGPALMMKRVEGIGWDEVLDARDLARDLDTFVQVCHAVHYAHTRGILHLDLKPENIMIGGFGEVYVLDWGLAASYGDDAPSWLTPAKELSGIAGTPGYMSPELVAGDAEAIGPLTDVYLLGAVLHHVVTGGPLHTGETLMLQLSRAFISEPQEYETDVPKELVRIIHRATEPRPEDRFESVDALRRAIEGFLQHRRADRTIARAETVLGELRDALGAEHEAIDIEPRFAECEVALEQARRAWAQHPRLTPLQDELWRQRFAYAESREDISAAREALARLTELDPSLDERLRALISAADAQAKRVARLEAMQRELDVTLGRQDRRRVFMGLGFVWAVICIGLGVTTRSGILNLGYTELLVEGLALVAVLFPYGYLRRKVLFQNRANRKLYGGLIFTALAVELFWVANMLLGVPVLHAVALTPMFYTFAFGTLAITLDPRFWWGTVPLAIASVATGLATTWTHDLIGIGGLCAVVATSWAWRES